MYERNVLDTHQDGLGKHVKLFTRLKEHTPEKVMEMFEEERKLNQLLVLITDHHGTEWIGVFCSDIVHVHLDGTSHSAMKAIAKLDWILESVEKFMKWEDKTISLTVVHNRPSHERAVPPATQRPY